MTPAEWLSRIAKDPALTPTQKAVAVALWSYMDRHGTCFPSMESICERAGIKKRDTARAAVDALVDLGHLSRSIQPRGRLSTNTYRAVDNTSRRPVQRVTTVTRLAGPRRPVQRAPLGDPSNGSLTSPRRTYAREDGPHPFIAALVNEKTLR